MSMTHNIHIAAGNRTLVSIADFQIPEHRITLLLGESGIGKSLIAKSLYGILDGNELTIAIDGKAYEDYLESEVTNEVRNNGFFVFQEPSTHLHPLLTLQSQLNEGTLAAAPHQTEILRQLWKTAPDDVRSLLDVYPKPHRPSGGEKQRMLLAMAFKKIDQLLANGREVTHATFVFDEPTGSLDNHHRDLFLEMLMMRFRKRNFTTLLITHDYSMIGKIHERYRGMVAMISFKELTLHHESLHLREFAPEHYLAWLQKQSTVETPMTEVAVRLPLMTIESDIEVFGRRLIISRQRDAKTPSPLTMYRGTMVYLKAASGTGKTTLAKLVMGLLQADRLDIQLDGLRLTEASPRRLWKEKIWGRKMTMVFQHADESLNPESSVQQVFEGLPSMRGGGEAQIVQHLGELFDADDLVPDFLNKKVKHLSGGQKQRLNLLRGLALDTDILILDEPLNGLDFESTGKVIAFVQQKQASGKAILLISHNEEIFDKIVSPDNSYFLSVELKTRPT
jgi:peptide/nickel transport system ATP-binding protein